MGVAIAGIAAGLLGAGASAYGASQQPKPGQGARQSTRETAQGTLQGYQQTAPLSYGLSQLYQPAYLGLGTSNLEQLLFGAPASSVNRTVGWGPLNNRGQYRYSANLSQDLPGSRGLFDLLGQAAPRLQELYNTGARQGAANQFGLLQDFMPQAQQYYEGAAPGLAELRRVLTDQAARGLKLGGQWNPDDLARVTGSIRGDWARRGLGTSLPALNEETLATLSGGEALRNQRQNFALNANQQVAGTTPDYARFILGLGGNPVGDTLGILSGQQGLAYQGNSFDPYNSAATQAGIAGMNTATAAALSNRDLYAGLGGGLLNLSGSLLGQYYGQQPAGQVGQYQAVKNSLASPVYRGG